jgi:ribosomal protein S18 acetylase RimI-like enzyme
MTPEMLVQVMQATWPPLRSWRAGPWIMRDGAGGGKRVSAATVDGAWCVDDVPTAESAMRAMAQQPLFLIGEGDTALDAALAARGYAIIDPVVAYKAPVAQFAQPAFMTTFPHWPPLSIAESIWADCGTDAARFAVMRRAQGNKTVILSRVADHPSGVAFVACHGTVAMLHALETLPAYRRQGSARNILHAAGHWAAAQGVATLTLVVTQANVAARHLYEGLGMQIAGRYHYRQRND